jgi:hypothetical protein
MSKNTECHITITETPDGKLSIIANIPDAAKETVAGVLAERLMAHSTEVMNAILGEDKKVEQLASH